MKIFDLKSNSYRFFKEIRLLVIDNRLIILQFLIEDSNKLS